MAEDWFFFDRRALRAIAERRRAEYSAASPYPHVVIDELVPAHVVERLHAGFPSPLFPAWKRKDHAEQAGRLGQLQRRGFDGVDPFLRHFLNELGAMAFLDFLASLTGVEGLVADPHFHGAGPSLVLPGGHLGVHADFNQDRFRGLRRRLTVLFYTNVGWDPAWGGELGLYAKDGRTCVRRIAPLANRLVVMTHASDAFHGHPEPLRCPPDRARQAISAYYYVAPRPGDPDEEPHAAIWR